MQKRDPRFNSEISGCSGAEEHGKFFPLAECDIFVNLTDVVLLSDDYPHNMFRELGMGRPACSRETS